jgi:hypothetical protein
VLSLKPPPRTPKLRNEKKRKFLKKKNYCIILLRFHRSGVVVILFIFPHFFSQLLFFVQRKKGKKKKETLINIALSFVKIFLTSWFWVLRCMIFLRYNITHALYIEEKKKNILLIPVRWSYPRRRYGISNTQLFSALLARSCGMRR